MTKLGTDDITELCIVSCWVKPMIRFASLVRSYLPLGLERALFSTGLDLCGGVRAALAGRKWSITFLGLDFGIDEWTYNNTYVEVLPNISSSGIWMHRRDSM